MSAQFDLTIASVVAEPNGGWPRLKIQGFCKYRDDHDIWLLSGIAHLQIGNISFPPVPFNPYEVLRRSRVQKGHQESFELYVWPNPDVLRTIEDTKSEPTVDLNLRLMLMVIEHRVPNKAEIGEAWIQMQQAFTIKQSQWTAVIATLGLGSRWRATVVVPKGPFAKELAAIEGDVNEAFGHLSSGRFDEALGSCRKVFEVLWEQMGDKSAGGGKWPANGAFDETVLKKLDAPHGAKSGKDLFSAKIYAQAESLHKLLHVGTHAGYAVTRPTAELCYSETLLILQVLSDALSR